MVECPLEGYDMSPFVTNTDTTKTSNSGNIFPLNFAKTFFDCLRNDKCDFVLCTVAEYKEVAYPVLYDFKQYDKFDIAALPSELQQQRPQVESSHTSNMWTNVFSSFKRDTSHKNSSNQGIFEIL